MRPAPTILAFIGLLVGGGAAVAEDAAARAPAERARTCYSAAETREKIAAAKLAEPFPLMRSQAAEHRAEAIGVKLCSVPPGLAPSGLVYEIDLLRRDGRLIHSRLDAASGKPLAGDVRK